jgi:broad specificity phosphatase PhoE
MARTIELRRHTDSDGDVLSEDGIRAALDIGARLRGGYTVLVSSGAQRATQTLGCFLAALGEKVEGGVVIEPALRSSVEDRWRDAYRRASSAELAALRSADPELVQQDSAALAEGLRRVLARLPDGGSALAVGHSPTNEAAVYGLTGAELEPMGKGRGVLLIADDAGVSVESLEP